MPCNSTYCINNTGLVGADDTYITGGTYNGNTYWSGQTNGWVIFYLTGTTSQWCLSDTFSGTCSLAGKTPCYSDCPDLSTAYVYSGVCPTPTPTPTNNCSVLDFNAVFDCEFIPTPTITPTSTITPTPTITPTATNPCSIIGIDAIAYRTPQSLPLMTMSENYEPLQLFEPLTILNCGVSGDVTFNLINDDIVCSSILTFQNCYDNELYYCSNVSLLPEQSLELYQVYQALVDNESNCIAYIGNSNNNVDINTTKIIITTYSFGNVNQGKCIECQTLPPQPAPVPPVLVPSPPAPDPTNICLWNTGTFGTYSHIYGIKSSNQPSYPAATLYYKLSGAPDSCYIKDGVKIGYPDYLTAAGITSFYPGFTYDIYLETCTTSPVSIKFGVGQNSGDFDSYCGISNPAQVTMPLISGMFVVPFYVNVRTADTGPDQFINQGYMPC